MKHTPEPWIIHENETLEIHPDTEDGSDGQNIIAEIPGDAEKDRQRANAERIVSCVNGCKGIADPEKIVPKLRTVFAILLNHIDRVIEACPEDDIDERGMGKSLNDSKEVGSVVRALADEIEGVLNATDNSEGEVDQDGKVIVTLSVEKDLTELVTETNRAMAKRGLPPMNTHERDVCINKFLKEASPLLAFFGSPVKVTIK